LIVAALAAVSAVVSAVEIPNQVVADPVLRAAYLFNFAKFIEWPINVSPPASPIRICSTDARVADELITLLSGKSISGRTVIGALVSPDASARVCAIVHGGDLSDRGSRSLVTALQGQPVFAIGDSSHFTDIGGAAHFYLERGSLRFAINLDVVRSAGLRIDPGLLQMARIIRSPKVAAP
jgi:hypothetical protein